MNEQLKEAADRLDNAIAQIQLEEITNPKVYALLMEAQTAVALLNVASTGDWD